LLCGQYFSSIPAGGDGLNGVGRYRFAAPIAAVMVILGHRLGLKVAAEGVETVQQREILLEQSCYFAQG
jgi:EAL domain-containing protein (putative c-di-GMP-specific phosphodiesterase class I)